MNVTGYTDKYDKEKDGTDETNYTPVFVEVEVKLNKEVPESDDTTKNEKPNGTSDTNDKLVNSNVEEKLGRERDKDEKGWANEIRDTPVLVEIETKSKTEVPENDVDTEHEINTERDTTVIEIDGERDNREVEKSSSTGFNRLKTR